MLPPREGLAVEGLPNLGDAGGAHGPGRLVELQAGRLPVQAACRHQPPRLGLEVVDQPLVDHLVDRRRQHRPPVVHQAIDARGSARPDARVVGPADAAEVGHPARQGHVARVAADVDQRRAREQEREQAEIEVIVRHLVNNPVRGRSRDGRDRGSLARPREVPSAEFDAPRRRRGRPGRAAMPSSRPTTAGIASKVCRASRSSPAPWTREWLASTCSTSVVPDRGMPKTKTGWRVSSPAPARRAKSSGVNASISRSTKRACSAGS